MSTDKDLSLMRNAVDCPIHSISPFTLLDFPERTACILWFSGCNMQCVYCYNPEIVFGNGKKTYQETLDFLEKRKGLLEGVVFSGGECTRAKGFVDFVKKVRAMGFQIKVDTNGSSPAIIQELLHFNLVDYVALDFKSLPSKFYSITNSKLFHRFLKSLRELSYSKIPYEVRTTFHSDILDLNDLRQMADFLKENGYHKKWFLQNFENATNTIGKLNPSITKLTRADVFNLNVQIRN